jgi:hypothetical protein
VLEASREVGLEVNVEKTKYMFMSYHQNVEHSHNLLIANKSFEKLTNLKYLGKTATNQNYIHKEIKRRLDSGSGCYYLVQNLLSPHFLSKSLTMAIYKNIILLVLYGFETWYLTLREE